MLLYGFGKMRDDARHTIKRISKDICKLFSKKFSIDIAEGKFLILLLCILFIYNFLQL